MNLSSAKYDFYEKVRVTTTAPEKQIVNGEIGAVIGRAQNDLGEWFYSVAIYKTDTSWHFLESELASTGEFDNREKFYDGSSIRVRVDKEGRGSIAEPEEKID